MGTSSRGVKKSKKGNMQFKWDQFKLSLASVVALLGIVVGGSPWLTGSLYRNYFVGGGLSLLFISWILANFQKKNELISQGRWKQQTKAMLAMGLCWVMGSALLIYYEQQMPKYEIALVDKELYRVPPQLSKKQLKELGAECNTYGNTLCSQAVFARIVQLDPRDYLSLANLAMAQSHLGFHQQAIHNFERAIKSGVKRYDVFKFYGHSLLALGDKSKAKLAYKASLSKNPNQKSLAEKIEKL